MMGTMLIILLLLMMAVFFHVWGGDGFICEAGDQGGFVFIMSLKIIFLIIIYLLYEQCKYLYVECSFYY